jgi:hypothetical protein
MNNELIRKIIDLSRDCLVGDDKETALALFNIAEKLVAKSRKQATGKEPIAKPAIKKRIIKKDDGGNYQGGGGCRSGSGVGGGCR